MIKLTNLHLCTDEEVFNSFCYKELKKQKIKEALIEDLKNTYFNSGDGCTYEDIWDVVEYGLKQLLKVEEFEND